jgi:expansin (peptidoglycan-binding protein)
LNLFEEGYRELVPTSNYRDKINIDWNVVSCAFSSPLAVQNKEGTSKYWFSIQIQNANWPVDAVHVSTDLGNTWENTISKDYNFFERKAGGGFDKDVVDLKISCFGGSVVFVRDVEIKDRKKIWADGNC